MGLCCLANLFMNRSVTSSVIHGIQSGIMSSQPGYVSASTSLKLVTIVLSFKNAEVVVHSRFGINPINDQHRISPNS
jgi:hypothetical protein